MCIWQINANAKHLAVSNLYATCRKRKAFEIPSKQYFSIQIHLHRSIYSNGHISFHRGLVAWIFLLHSCNLFKTILDCCEFCDFGRTPKNVCFQDSINHFPSYHTLPVMLHFHSLQAGVCMIRFHVDSNKIGAFELSVFPYLVTIPNWKILVKLNHFPNYRAKNQKWLKPPARFETNLFPAPENAVLVYPQNAHREVGSCDDFWKKTTASHQTSSKHSRSRTPKPPRGGKASSKDPDQWNN